MLIVLLEYIDLYTLGELEYIDQTFACYASIMQLPNISKIIPA